MNMKTCFDILNISRNASIDEAKRSYKRLVKRWHPDQFASNPEKQRFAHEKLKEINVAYRDVIAALKHETVHRNALHKARTTSQEGNVSSRNFKEKKSFLERMAEVFKNKAETETASTSPAGKQTARIYRTQEENNNPLRRWGDNRADFQNVLNRAIRNQPGTGSGRKTTGDGGNRAARKLRPRQGNSGAAVSRANIRPRHIRGDKVEKIRPVGRIGKIGE